MQDELEARVKKLERENRRVKVGALLALVLVGGVVCSGQTQTSEDKVLDTIKTRKLIVVDEAGKPRAALGITGGDPGLFLYSEAEEVKVALALSSSTGPGLHLFGQTQKGNAVLAATPMGPALGLYDDAGTIRAGLSITSAGPGVQLYDEAGRGRVALIVDPSGPGLGLLDEHQNVIWSTKK